MTTPTDGDDELTGSGGDDTIEGLAGDDVIVDPGGIDALFGDHGSLTVTADDIAFGDDVLIDKVERGALFGDGNAITLDYSGAGALTFTLGDDQIYGARTWTAPSGSGVSYGDLQVIVTTDGVALSANVTVTGGNDIIVVPAGTFSYGDFGVTVYHADGGGLLEALGGDDFIEGTGEIVGDFRNVTFRGEGATKLTGGNDVLVAGDTGSTMFGEMRLLTVREDAKNAVKVFVAGDDTLVSGPGPDVMYGDVGFVDAQNARPGTLVLERGADVFVFEPGHGPDMVIDFTPGQDTIELRGFGPGVGFGDLIITQGFQGQDPATFVFTPGQTDLITLINVSVLTAQDFLFN